MESIKDKARQFLDELDSRNSISAEEAKEWGFTIEDFTESDMSEAFEKADAYQKLAELFMNCMPPIEQNNEEELMIQVAELAQYLDEYWIFEGFDYRILFALFDFLSQNDDVKYDRFQVPILRCMYDFTENKSAAARLLHYLAHIADESYKGYIKLQALKLLKSRYIFCDEELRDLNFMAELN